MNVAEIPTFARPLSHVVRTFATETRLLCFDELAVTEIADVLMLGRVLTELLSRGVVLVATKVDPDRLYEGGIYRELLLPFVARLKLYVDVVNLDARTDFRLEKRQYEGGWYTPADAGDLGYFSLGTRAPKCGAPSAESDWLPLNR